MLARCAFIRPARRPSFGAARVTFGRLAASAARLLVRIQRAQKKVVAPSSICGQIVFSLTLATSAFAVTPANTLITNTATTTYTVGAGNFTATATAAIRTAGCVNVGIRIELLQYVSPARAAQSVDGTRIENIPPSQYSPSGAIAGPFASVGNVVLPGNQTSTALPAALLVAPMNDAAGRPNASYARNEPVFIRVVSVDANTNAAVAETLTVVLTSSGGDSEVLQLTETGPATGVFIGALPTTTLIAGVNTRGANDGKLTISANNETISAVYNHSDCVSGSSFARTSSSVINSSSIVFDAATGAPVNGARISMINSRTGLLASVLCDDGVTLLPQPITSGVPTICDATVAAGGYRFPVTSPGSYRLLVVPPTGYSFPSTVPAANLPTLIGAPLTASVIVGSPAMPNGSLAGASYGGAFLLSTAMSRIDLPVDAGATALTILKSVGRPVVGIGEFVPYTLTINNSSTNKPIMGALIADQMPPGFRYQRGSLRVDGAIVADPLISADGRTLTFNINLPPAGSVTLRYALEVTPAARIGAAENVAVATGGFSSNTARANVLVRDDLFRSKVILIGRVIDAPCDVADGKLTRGLANARIVLEDGTYVLTDKDGRWHIDNVRPGTHVVQLDMDSIPSQYEIAQCQQNTRFAGRSSSQFVNVRAGSLWRADFYVKQKLGNNGAPISSPNAPSIAPDAAGEATNASANAATAVSASLIEQLPYDAAWLASATPGNVWLHPQTDFRPNLPVVKVAVKHNPAHRLQLKVNGAVVSPLLFVGAQNNAAADVTLSTWNAVPISEGANTLELVITDASGGEVSRTIRSIHFAAVPDHIEFVPALSRLIADGKTRPIIAIRFMDKSGVPVRSGLSGEFQLNEPYFSAAFRESLEREPLTGLPAGKPRFEIQSDGVALIALEPTTQSGEAVLNFQLNDTRKHEVRAWLKAGRRDWILVGFAEGTIGHKTLTGNAQALQHSEIEKQLFDDNKVAFFAKGSIRGDYLLTIAYDSAKQTGNNILRQAINPTQYYTLYADATQARYDAASGSRLYVKLERDQFYAMFGDIDSGLTVTELSRYSRTLTGIKTEYKGEQVGVSAFASLTAQSYAKDEIPGNGTSGVYRLSRGKLMINSDKIRLETRDRFQSQVIIATSNLTRYLDYDIDYQLGTLTFREPINVRDRSLNPIYIVVEYESADPADKAATYGGRAHFKPNKAVELGATLIHEGTVGATGNLQGVDASIQIDANTKVRAEWASTQRNAAQSSAAPGNPAGSKANGNAWLAEIQHHAASWDAKAYLREQAVGFGLGQQAGSETGTRKAGVDGRYKFSDSVQLQGMAYQQENLLTGATNDVVEGRIDQKVNDQLNAYYGARNALDKTSLGVFRSRQVIGGATYALRNQQLMFNVAAELSPGTAASAVSPDRLLLGADYKLTDKTRMFAEQEFARGDKLSANNTRIGLRTMPWIGSEVSTSLGSGAFNDAERLYGNIGLVQRWQINPGWQADVSLDRSHTLRNAGVPLTPATPLAFGSPAGDYTTAAAGAGYSDLLWSGNGRIEARNSALDRQRNLQFGMQRKLDEGRSLALGFVMRNTGSASGSTRDADLRWSYAHRPSDSKWVWFDRLDYITQSRTSDTASLKGEKLVNNLNANYLYNRRTQIALQYGAKYVRDSIDGVDHKGYTDLIGFEVRHDLNKDWDVAVFGSMLRSLNAGVRDTSVGASVGYKVMENLWVSVGYNARSLDDRDFNGASYGARGVFLSLRLKVDQDTFGLNKRSTALLSNSRKQ